MRAAIVLPAGFGARPPRALMGGGAKPVVAVHYDPSQATALPLVRGLLTQHVMKALGESLGGVRAAPAPVAGAFSLPSRHRGRRHRPRAADRPYNGYAHSFAGMGVQFILFMGIEVGVGVLLARRLGLWKRLRAAPLSRSLLLGSHIVSGAITALILLAIIYAAAIGIFHVRIDGSVAGFVGIAIAFALLTSSFGLLIAAIGKTPEATRGLAIFATLVMVMLGGAWVPSFVFPQWLQTASLVVPTRWAVDGLDAMTWRGLGFEAAIEPIVVLLALQRALRGDRDLALRLGRAAQLITLLRGPRGSGAGVVARQLGRAARRSPAPCIAGTADTGRAAARTASAPAASSFCGGQRGGCGARVRPTASSAASRSVVSAPGPPAQWSTPGAM